MYTHFLFYVVNELNQIVKIPSEIMHTLNMDNASERQKNLLTQKMYVDSAQNTNILKCNHIYFTGAHASR